METHFFFLNHSIDQAQYVHPDSRINFVGISPMFFNAETGIVMVKLWNEPTWMYRTPDGGLLVMSQPSRVNGNVLVHQHDPNAKRLYCEVCDTWAIAEVVDESWECGVCGSMWNVNVECAYCGEVCTEPPVPAVDDDVAWADLAKEHAPDCEWVLTRAHREVTA